MIHSPAAPHAAAREEKPMASKVEPIPAGFHAITPHIVVAGCGDAIAFYAKAFGADERFRMPGPDGRIMHAEIQIGDCVVMMADEMPEMDCRSPKTLGGSPVTLHLYVEDTDAAYQRAIEAGATAVMPPEDMFWGDRYARVTDPFGHAWAFATHQRDLTPEEIYAGMAEAMAPPQS